MRYEDVFELESYGKGALKFYFNSGKELGRLGAFDETFSVRAAGSPESSVQPLLLLSSLETHNGITRLKRLGSA